MPLADPQIRKPAESGRTLAMQTSAHHVPSVKFLRVRSGPAELALRGVGERSALDSRRTVLRPRQRKPPPVRPPIASGNPSSACSRPPSGPGRPDIPGAESCGCRSVSPPAHARASLYARESLTRRATRKARGMNCPMQSRAAYFSNALDYLIALSIRVNSSLAGICRNLRKSGRQQP